ncbi:MAG: hypothetical protein ACYTJ0_11945 [Planctomycetota bacterium]|jgi:hypothetical protein
MSGWALAAFLLASAVLCPPLPLIGALLGIRALSHVRAVPGRGGHRLAVAAILLGLAATIGWTAAGWWWNGHVRRPILAGPAAALDAGFAGDLAGFRDGFTARAASEADAGRFLQELAARYGAWRGLEPGRDAAAAAGAPMTAGGVDCPYRLRFDRQTVDAVARFVIFEPGAGFVGGFGRLEVLDPDRGRLVYPPEPVEAPTSAPGP